MASSASGERRVCLPEIVLVPLIGHTRGHCGVAVADARGLAAARRRRLLLRPADGGAPPLPADVQALPVPRSRGSPEGPPAAREAAQVGQQQRGRGEGVLHPRPLRVRAALLDDGHLSRGPIVHDVEASPLAGKTERSTTSPLPLTRARALRRCIRRSSPARWSRRLPDRCAPSPRPSSFRRRRGPE